MLADLAGLDSLVLLAAEGKPPPAGVTFLESSSSGLSARLRRLLRQRCAHGDAGTWPEWINPGGNDAATIIGAAVASTVQAPAERSWFTESLALLASVARVAEQWEPPLRSPQDAGAWRRGDRYRDLVVRPPWRHGVDQPGEHR